MSVRFHGECLLAGAMLACCTLAQSAECLLGPGPLRLGTVDPVMHYMIDHVAPDMKDYCLAGTASTPASILEKCFDSVNHEFSKRYGTITKSIEESMARINAITLPVDGEGNMACPGSKNGAKKVTSAPIQLPYHIAPGNPKAQSRDLDDMISALKLDKIPDKALSVSAVRLSLGRGSAEDYQRAVRRLACVSGSEFATPEGAKAALAKAKIGVDCAGAVQINLRDAAGKTDNHSLGLGNSTNEAFYNGDMLKRPKSYRHTTDPLAIRPGDVIPLDRPNAKIVGHVVIAQDVQFEVAKKDSHLAGKTPGDKDIGFDTHPNDQLMKVKVGSSWGGDGPSVQTWVYNMRTKQWAAEKPDGSYFFDVSGPYNHPYAGQYRFNEFIP
ncbi:MAG: hypothetical protein HY074_08635 [Deltaproteobacteria bacterium]|nr:hypothetical protein [Deltaproteobacteria bacterium]